MRKLLINCAAAVSIGMSVSVAVAAETTVASLDNPNGTTTVDEGDTLTVTGNVTQTTDSDAGRFNKAGDGTLILKGANNTFKRMTHSAGKLVFDGGATTVTGGSGSGAGASMNVLLNGDETVVTGGGSFTVGTASGTQYAGFRSNRMIVTNGTVDVTALNGELLCNFINGSLSTRNSSGIVTIGKGGTFRARVMRHFQNVPSNLQDKFGFNVVDGGALEITGRHGLRLDPAIAASSRYGFLHFDGGTLVNSYASDGDTYLPWVCSGSDPVGTWANCPITIGEKGATVKNAVAKNLQIRVPFKTGAASDGGLHFNGPGTTYLYATGATYNGGTHLESIDGGILALSATYGDTSLGAVPASPEANIWIKGSNHTLFNQSGTFTINPNRTVFVKNGKTLYTGANTNARLVFGGLVRGEAVGDLEYSTNTIFWVKDTWSGTTVLGPGAGRTNDIGRLVVLGALEITNGVTTIASATAGTTVNDAMLYITAGGATGSGTKGRLMIKDGGILSTQETNTRYVVMANYGQTDICGGTVDFPKVEWLNALNAPALTTVSDGGFLNVETFRITQGVTNGNPTVVRLGTNGLMRVNQLALDLSKAQPDVTFLFDGGAIQSASGYSAASEKTTGTDKRQSFIRDSTNAKWAGVKFAIGPGGAVFDTCNNKNLFWYRPLVKATAGVSDGGITARGNTNEKMAVCLMVAADYNGPTIVDGTTFQQRGGDNLIPSGTKLVLRNGGKASFCTYDSGYQSDTTKHTAATLGGIEGDGEVRYCTHVTVNGKIAPSIGGTISFHKPLQSLSGTLEIAGDATGCGKVKFDENQDISGLALKITDVSSFDSKANGKFYKFIDAPKGITGTFTKSADFPSDWDVRYSTDGKSVYVYHVKGTVFVFR